MTRLLYLLAALLLIVLLLMFFGTPGFQGGDFGDAPEGDPAYPSFGSAVPTPGAFPSLLGSNNVRLAGNDSIFHVDPDPPLRLGFDIDAEMDARVVDADADDASPTLAVGGFGTSGRFWFNASTLPGNPNRERFGYVNILLDLNQDGVWAEHTDGTAQVEEWVVKNVRVSVRAGGFERMRTPPFAFGPTSARNFLWSRFSLTPQPIAAATYAGVDGWDGSGPAAGHARGETEDWYFPCEGSLDISYPNTLDDFNDRLNAPFLPGGPPTEIVVTNTATQPVAYVMAARAQVAVPFGFGYFYVDVDRADPEWSLTLTPVPDPGVSVGPVVPITPTPDTQFTISMPPGTAVKFTITAVDNNVQPVLDPTRPPPPGADNRLGRVLFHPLGPCLLQLTKTNDEPVFVQWP